MKDQGRDEGDDVMGSSGEDGTPAGCSHPRLFVPEDGIRRCAICHVERPEAPLTMGDLGRAIGRYTESEGGDSEETLAAHRGLFAIYDRWVDLGRPENSDGYDRIRGWMGVEDDEGRIALTQRAEAALTAEPWPVFRVSRNGGHIASSAHSSTSSKENQ